MTRRCLFCRHPLTRKRPQALYCNEQCGRSYRHERVHRVDASRVFWEGVSRVSRGPRSDA